jgi:pyruvate dehydrogenase E2 component (dihydrolipoamide acetyltransferase)
MTRWEFKLPDIGEGVTEGEIVAWHIKPGVTIKEDEPMVDVMTDKATVTITSPKAGAILETVGKVGDIVQVHGTLVVFDLGAAGAAASAAQAGAAASVVQGHAAKAGANGGKSSAGEGPAATAVGDIKESLPGMGTQAARSTGAGAARHTMPVPTYFNEKPLATPATRKTARDLNIDLKVVPPTGPQGRTTKEDVERFVGEARTPTNLLPPAPSTGTPHATPTTPTREAVRVAPLGGTAGDPVEERVPFAGMRRKIATKMALSKHTAAHFTFVEECEASALKAMRTRLRPAAEKSGVKLTFLPFIVKAVVASLKKHAILNSALDESTNELVYRKVYNIGIATSTDAGLMVPVIKNCERRSILDIAREIERVGADAKAGKSRTEDLTGSTFTITSLGAQGGLFATPILNFPEVGILGVHQMKEKPIVKDGKIVIGNVMLLSLSFDHRIVDGHVGAAFAYDIIGYLENPESLFLEA